MFHIHRSQTTAKQSVSVYGWENQVTEQPCDLPELTQLPSMRRSPVSVLLRSKSSGHPFLWVINGQCFLMLVVRFVESARHHCSTSSLRGWERISCRLLPRYFMFLRKHWAKLGLTLCRSKSLNIARTFCCSWNVFWEKTSQGLNARLQMKCAVRMRTCKGRRSL